MTSNLLGDVNGARECCKEDGNLRVIESKATKTVRECVICGARHHEFVVDAGVLTARMFGNADPPRRG